jgi:Lrp/AsnC family leucine-responsive transcriptional regulator
MLEKFARSIPASFPQFLIRYAGFLRKSHLIRGFTAMVDAIDRKILRELQIDGRIPWVELADRVALSASACQRRVQALMERGVIQSISAHLDPVALGYEVQAYVSVHVDRQDVARAKKFRTVVGKYPEVIACHMLTGEVDYLLLVVARDLRSFGHFVEEKILGMPGVKDASSSIVLDQIKLDSSLLG